LSLPAPAWAGVGERQNPHQRGKLVPGWLSGAPVRLVPPDQNRDFTLMVIRRRKPEQNLNGTPLPAF
jgi:hypothetical protein